jgi:hypothetical protein
VPFTKELSIKASFLFCDFNIKQGAEENIWTKERLSDGRLEETAK